MREQTTAASPRKPDVGADAFFRLDLRVGRILDVEDLAGARKPAWKLTVDFGEGVGTLQTSAQVKNYERDELLDRLVVGVVNVGAKRIAGFRSEFLILGAIEGDGTVRLLRVEDEVPPGSPIA